MTKDSKNSAANYNLISGTNLSDYTGKVQNLALKMHERALCIF